MGQLLQPRDELIPIGHAAGADLVRHAGSQDLLGAPPATPAGARPGPVDPGMGQGLQLGDNLVEAAEPDGLIGHKAETQDSVKPALPKARQIRLAWHIWKPYTL